MTTIFVDHPDTSSIHAYNNIRRETDKNQLLQSVVSTFKGMTDLVTANLDGMKVLKAKPGSNVVLVNVGNMGLSVSSMIARKQKLVLHKHDMSRPTSENRYKEIIEQTGAFNDALRQHTDPQLKLISALKSDSYKSGMGFMVQAGKDMLVSGKLFIGQECTNCGEIVNANTFKAHGQSMLCMTGALVKDVKEQGFMEVDGQIAKAVIKAGIGVEYRPKEMSVWVPTWVGQALEVWDKNPGYAGLKLDEYLRRMKPDETK